MTTAQAREARHQARLLLIARHERSAARLREHLAINYAEDPERATDTAATINYHLARMDYHIGHLEAGT